MILSLLSFGCNSRSAIVFCLSSPPQSANHLQTSLKRLVPPLSFSKNTFVQEVTMATPMFHLVIKRDTTGSRNPELKAKMEDLLSKLITYMENNRDDLILPHPRWRGYGSEFQHKHRNRNRNRAKIGTSTASTTLTQKRRQCEQRVNRCLTPQRRCHPSIPFRLPSTSDRYQLRDLAKWKALRARGEAYMPSPLRFCTSSTDDGEILKVHTHIPRARTKFKGQAGILDRDVDTETSKRPVTSKRMKADVSHWYVKNATVRSLLGPSRSKGKRRAHMSLEVRRLFRERLLL